MPCRTDQLVVTMMKLPAWVPVARVEIMNDAFVSRSHANRHVADRVGAGAQRPKLAREPNLIRHAVASSDSPGRPAGAIPPPQPPPGLAVHGKRRQAEAVRRW